MTFRCWTPGSSLVNLLQGLAWLALGTGFLTVTVGRWTELFGLPLFVLACLLGINRVARARDALSLAAVLTTDELGVTVDARQLPWTELGLVHESISPFVVTRYLELYDREGRRHAKLCPARGDYLILRALLSERCGEPSRRAQQRLAASQGWLLLGMGAFFVCFGLFALGYFGVCLREIYLLNTRGVPVQATITRLFLSPNGMNRLVTYRIPDSDVTHDAILDPPYWETLKEGEELPVRTVPGEPGLARVPLYEEEQITPVVLLILGLGGLGVLTYGLVVVRSGKEAMASSG